MSSCRRARGDEAHAPSPRASAACMRGLLRCLRVGSLHAAAHTIRHAGIAARVAMPARARNAGMVRAQCRKRKVMMPSTARAITTPVHVLIVHHSASSRSLWLTNETVEKPESEV
jgi:hypothetical protein